MVYMSVNKDKVFPVHFAKYMSSDCTQDKAVKVMYDVMLPSLNIVNLSCSAKSTRLIRPLTASHQRMFRTS